MGAHLMPTLRLNLCFLCTLCTLCDSAVCTGYTHFIETRRFKAIIK